MSLIHGGAVAALLVTVGAACDSGGAGVVSAQPFQVAYISPEAGSSGVSLRAPIHVVFTHPVDESTLNEDSFVIESAQGARIRGDRRVSRLTPTTVSFLPIDSYKLGEEHLVLISEAARDIFGEPLAHAYGSVFSTRGSRPSITPPGTGGGNGTPTTPCDPSGITLWYSDGTGGSHAVDTDTLDQLDAQEQGHPSHQLHGCMRWFLTTEESNISLSSGSFATRLLAISSRGDRVTLVEAATNRDIGRGSPYCIRWAKDDSFASFTLVGFSGKSQSGHLMRIAVDWNSGAPTAAGNAEEKLDNVGVDGSGNIKLVAHDWAPSGTRYVYEMNDLLRTFEPATGIRVNLGAGSVPEWSPIGPDATAKIAYHHHPTGGRVMNPDGTGDMAVATSDNKWAHGSPPSWSPDGKRMAVAASLRGGGLATVDADGSNFTVIFENTGSIQLHGWR